MTRRILVVSNFRNSSMSYMGSLHGFGFDIEDTRTFETARILLRAEGNFDAIIIDVKFHADEIADFIRGLRANISKTIKVVVIGCEQETYDSHGADDCLVRPVNFEEIIQVLKTIR